MIDLKGKVAVVFGLANKRSIAWAICQKLSSAGASLAICYQSERLQRDAEELAADLPGAKTFRCDVSVDAEIDAVFSQFKEAYGKLDIVVHSIGFAPNIKNDVLQTTREDFRIAHDVSAYSLIALARGAEPLMTEGGSILTLTYYGSTKVFPNYNIMGVAKAALEAVVRGLAADLGAKKIRVNAISARPRSRRLRLAASGTSRRSSMRSRNALRCTAMSMRRRWATPLSSGERSSQRHHRRDHLCRLRLQHHGPIIPAGRTVLSRRHSMPLTDLLLAELDQEMKKTRTTLERVPEDKPDFKPHEKSMSMARLAGHLAELPQLLSMILTMPEVNLATAGRKSVPMATRQELLATFDTGAATARAELAATADAAMHENWKLSAGPKMLFDGSRYHAVRSFFFNHVIHHRAQLGVYLRLNDVPVPSIYGPSADEPL